MTKLRARAIEKDDGMTMVERVAKAMCAADGYLPDAESNDGEGQMLWTTYAAMARAAIEAMKEPTPGMPRPPGDYTDFDKP